MHHYLRGETRNPHPHDSSHGFGIKTMSDLLRHSTSDMDCGEIIHSYLNQNEMFFMVLL